MKFVILIAVAIVSVSGKSLSANELLTNPELAQNVREMQNEFKDVEASMRADNGAGAMTVLSFMTSLDKDVRSDIMKDSAKTLKVIVDATKTMENKLHEVAAIAQNTADLWKLAEKKYRETNPAPVTVAAPAA